MGTSIECFFAHDQEWEPAALERRLNELCAAFAPEVEAIGKRGRFSSGGGGWYVVPGAADPGEPGYLLGEGPAGLDVYVYRRVFCLGSNERFGALYDESYGIATALRRVICSFSESLARPSAIAVAAAGFGDTDGAGDVGHSGGSFDDVCRELRRVAGDPTDDWSRLGEAGWYLGPAVVSPGASPAG
jgi:hypothetical protein